MTNTLGSKVLLGCRSRRSECLCAAHAIVPTTTRVGGAIILIINKVGGAIAIIFIIDHSSHGSYSSPGLEAECPIPRDSIAECHQQGQVGPGAIAIISIITRVNGIITIMFILTSFHHHNLQPQHPS